MGKVLVIPIVVLAVLALIVLPQVFFTVDETQLAIVTRFGEFQDARTQPGLYTKTPFVESVRRFESRLLRVDAPTASLLTSDNLNLVIDAYARYRIVNPLLFFQTLTGESDADARVRDIVASQLRREVALDLQSEVISETRLQVMQRITTASNRSEISRAEAQALPQGIRNPDVTVEISRVEEDANLRGRPATEEELAALESDPNPPILGDRVASYFVPLSNALGIEIVDVRIKRADFPPDIATSVFARMEAERERIASGLRAEGAQRDSEIRAEVDRDVQVLLETAQGTSSRVRGEAEREAIQILAESLSQDPEFYDFRRSLEAYKVALASNTTILLDSESDLFKFLEDPFGVEADGTPDSVPPAGTP
ncbi:MAG: protease modulator HflC [Dehalococcoidia bacterium]